MVVSTRVINGMPLPRDLIALVEAGRWKQPADLSGFDRLFPALAETKSFLKFTLYSLDYMQFENRHWLNQTDPMFLGTRDHENPPGDIDPSLSLLVGDLGFGLEQPIALDYRLSIDEPRVLTLNWWDGGRESRWVVIARSVRTFADLVGL
jgi:hypothetical protein